MENYSFETVETTRERGRAEETVARMYEDCGRLLGACQPPQELPPLPVFKTCVIEVSFDAIKGEVEQRRFLNLPTSFDLPPSTVDDVVAMGATLLRQSPYFATLVRKLGGHAAGGPEPSAAECE